MKKDFEVSTEECKKNHSEFVGNVMDAIEPFANSIKNSKKRSLVVLAMEDLGDHTAIAIGVVGTSKNIADSVIKLAEQNHAAKSAMGIVTINELANVLKPQEDGKQDTTTATTN